LISPVFKVVSLSFLLNGLNLVPAAMIYKQLQFKANSIQTLIAAIVSGGVGIMMAYNGYGVWSLVGQSLLSSLILLVLNFAYIKWLPGFLFSFASMKPLWNYGSRLFASGILDSIYTRLDTFIIAKIFAPSTLGYYIRAQSMDNMVRQFSAVSIMGALFPYIAKHQADRMYLKELYKKYLHIISFLSIGISGVLFLTAKNLFTVLFTSRWAIAAELFQLMSLAGFAWPVSALMCNIIAGVGNSSAFLKLEVYKKILFLPVYVFGFLFGLKGFIICVVIAACAAVILNGIFTGRELKIGALAQMRIILSYLGLGVLSCLLSYLLFSLLPYMKVLRAILILTSSFSFFYLLGSYLFGLRGIDVIFISFKRLKLAFQ
jgi:O-antigen/teichoic acid export membrane protein